MKNILVPSDFSEHSFRAMDYALRLAAKTGASVHVLHCIFPNQDLQIGGDYGIWVDDYIKQRKIDTHQWASNFGKKRKNEGISISSDAQMGFPVSLILTASEDYDLVVMGTIGSTGILSNLLGSVTAAVIRQTEIPVLTIPPKVTFRASRPLVFATDFRASLSKKAQHTLHAIANLHRPKVRMLHVRKDTTVQPSASEEAKFQEKIAIKKAEFHYLTDSNIESAVSNFVEAVDAGGLITVSHDHTLFYKLFHQSVSQTLAGELNVPVLVMKDTKA